ncbi:hypothetical protein BX616_007639 [Lobosporangium transversale]|uniref:GDSL lipase/esterase n=1 Tax=Lobosporangium transversale TaxID=64571 RepID=A0A1Y2GDU1_9FUNG|nr:GDSL lipase/esterase [Lobosporangium transversale]KAF9914751.1 hypothetical protein BX616_007639 [Lobosporangium transversale]ORZ08019.1 GDSL lipase/esterase [Lobosporangium transversale]|eukprot:XP_021878253.1 GDSL lipase/esterase [Lobosporangium transversale]
MLVKFIFMTVVAVAVSLPSALATPVRCTLKKLVVFGDSFSESGNVYKLSNKTWPPPFYYKGRFSNGPAWPDYVVKARNYQVVNYAYGGATTDSDLVQGLTGQNSNILVPGFLQQLDIYASKYAQRAIAESVFVINFQGNDFFFDISLDPSAVVDRIHTGIKRLVSMGARRILVIQNQNIGLIPYAITNTSLADAYSKKAKEEQAEFGIFAAEVKEEYGSLAGPGSLRTCNFHDKEKAKIAFFDLTKFFAYLYQPKELRRLGITDVTHGCVSIDYKNVCKNPGKHFFWDAFHPSAKIQMEIAKAVLNWL